MKLATLRTSGGRTTAALATGDDTYVALPASDVGAFLGLENWRAIAESAEGEAQKGLRFEILCPVSAFSASPR